MKGLTKILSLILAVIFAATGLTLAVSAAGEGSLTITGYEDFAVVTSCRTSATGVIDIPSTKNGLPVTRIGNGAFEDCSMITQVNIPSSVTHVGDNAFSSCTALRKIVFDGSECTIGIQAFSSCSDLAEITLPSGLKKIPDEAFAGCVSLSGIVIPETVEVIGKEAFRICTKLTYIYIPASVKVIKKNAFLSCNGATSYNVASGNTVYSSANGVLYGPYQSPYDTDFSNPVADKTLIQYPSGSAVTSYTVSADTLIIGDYAFGGNNKLTSVKLPNGLEKIDSYAFYECSSLSAVNIPSTVTEIGSLAFGKCTALKSVTISASVKAFESAFYASGLESVVFANGVKVIDTKSFDECRKLKSVTIPSGVEEIKLGAFYNCTSLGSVEIPSSVKTIENAAFGGCTNLKLIVEDGSAAHKYAVNNNIPFEIKAVIPDPPVDPTDPVVKRVTGIKINSIPVKLDYNYKDTIDTSGLSIKVYYSEGEPEILYSDFDVSPKTCTNRGIQTVTVEYEKFTDTFEVNVTFTVLQWIIWILLLGFLWY